MLASVLSKNAIFFTECNYKVIYLSILIMYDVQYDVATCNLK